MRKLENLREFNAKVKEKHAKLVETYNTLTETEAKIKAENEARINAEKEAKSKAENEARIKAEKEARNKAENETRIKDQEQKKTALKKSCKTRTTKCSTQTNSRCGREIRENKNWKMNFKKRCMMT